MQSKITLEVCAYNLQSCMVAEKAGATRVELCADPLQGGTTPAYGLIKMVREKSGIQLYPIIRPREGDFCYSEEEFSIIKSDIGIIKELGCDGISTGLLLRSGEIDTERMKCIVEWAYPMHVTCHRAFDVTPDPFQALEDLIACGCVRILTSGQKPKAVDAIDTLKVLVKAAGDRLSIMPGGGVRSGNIALLKTTEAQEFHTSARLHPQPSAMDVDILGVGQFYIADEQEIRQILSLVN